MITLKREWVLVIGSGLLAFGLAYGGVYFVVISGLLTLGALLWLTTSKAN